MTTISKNYNILTKAFGPPDSQSSGFAIWAENLYNKKIFGMPVCFHSIILSSGKLPLKVNIRVNPTISQYHALLRLSDNSGFDLVKKLFYAKCTDIKYIIATLTIASDILVTSSEGIDMSIILNGDAYNTFQKAVEDNLPQAKVFYARMCKNLVKHFQMYPDQDIYWRSDMLSHVGVPQNLEPLKNKPKSLWQKFKDFVMPTKEGVSAASIRFAKDTVVLRDDAGSKIQGIHRTYGTVEQKRGYPKYININRKGWFTLGADKRERDKIKKMEQDRKAQLYETKIRFGVDPDKEDFRRPSTRQQKTQPPKNSIQKKPEQFRAKFVKPPQNSSPLGIKSGIPRK